LPPHASIVASRECVRKCLILRGATRRPLHETYGGSFSPSLGRAGDNDELLGAVEQSRSRTGKEVALFRSAVYEQGLLERCSEEWPMWSVVAGDHGPVAASLHNRTNAHRCGFSGSRRDPLPHSQRALGFRVTGECCENRCLRKPKGLEPPPANRSPKSLVNTPIGVFAPFRVNREAGAARWSLSGRSRTPQRIPGLTPPPGLGQSF